MLSIVAESRATSRSGIDEPPAKDLWLRSLRYTCLLLFSIFSSTVFSSEINLALENADIKELIRWAAETTDKNIILHPGVTGKVTVLAGEAMNEEEAYRVFLSVLQVHGLTVVESNNALKVIPVELAKQDDIRLVESTRRDDEDYGFDSDVVVRVLKMRNVTAASVVGLLQPLMSKSAYITAYPDTNLLILSDRASTIARLEQIIQRIDIAGLIDIELIELEFASASDVIRVIQQLVPQTEGAGGFTIAEDERSNSILMTGDPVIRQQLRGLIARLDKPQSGEGNTQVVYVNFTNAASLVPALESISGSAVQTNRDQTYANVDVKIVVNEENNALVITAPPALQETMKSVIRKLDVRRAQVLVEAIIVEVNNDHMRDIGVEWQSNFNSDDVFVGGSTLGTLGAPAPPSFGEGLTLGFFSSGELRGLLRALESDTESNVLSTPTIVALDNEEAEILVGSNVPFITGQSTGAASGTDNPFQTITRQDIGISLKVKPRINNDGSITLTVEQSVESISPATAADIITNKREIKTRVLIENDEVLVLGGLISDELNETERKIPILGSLPLIGKAFKSTNRQMVKRNLMVFIHPKILLSRAQNDAVTRDRYQRVQQLQDRFNGNGKNGEGSTIFRVPKPGPRLEDLPPRTFRGLKDEPKSPVLQDSSERRE